MSSWVGSKAGGYFETNLQIAFMIKFCLAMVIVAAVIVNLSCKFIFKRPSPLGNIHPIALTLAVAIVFLQKLCLWFKDRIRERLMINLKTT